MWDKDRLKFVGLEFSRLEIDKDTTEKITSRRQHTKDSNVRTYVSIVIKYMQVSE